MGLPIIDDIFSGVRWIIDTFLNKAPRPIQIIIFLMMLLVFVSIIPFFTHLVGIHCTSDLQPVKTSPLSVSNNLRLAFMDRDDLINATVLNPEELGALGGFTDCAYYICNDSGILTQADSTFCDNLTKFYIYKTTAFDWSRCTNCDGTEFYTGGFRFNLDLDQQGGYWCNGDIERKDRDDMNFYQKFSCDSESRCMPPINYYWEVDTGRYECNNLDECGVNLTEENITPLVDQILVDFDAELLYTDTDLDFKKTVYIKCDGEASPHITVFGIPVFDYKIWLILYIIGGMFLFLSKIRR